jgi:hypothetical protein
MYAFLGSRLWIETNRNAMARRMRTAMIIPEINLIDSLLIETAGSLGSNTAYKYSEN